MKKNLRWLLVSGLLASAMTANASSLVGEWTGTGLPVPADGTSEAIDLNFLTQVPDGSGFDLTGTVDITCVNNTDPKCGTRGVAVSFTGSLLNQTVSMIVATPGGDDTFNGTLSTDQSSLTGVLSNSGSGFEADWTLTPVPLPASWLLLGSMLVGLTVLQRRTLLRNAIGSE